MCTYFNDGVGLNELVATLNLSLDNTIRAEIDAAINSFAAIDENYGSAIYYQPVQIMNTQSKINDLKETLETDLINFINTNVRD